jgi:DNA-binding NarL/FixJ family response regulator
VCDDHQLFLEAVGRAFAARGHDVVGLATDPWEAVDQVVELQPDVCVMDLVFPDGHGIDVVRAIRDRAPQVKVLVLSGSADSQTAWSVLQSGAHGFVGKDQPVDGVFAALDRLAGDELAFDLGLLRDADRPDPARPEHSAIRSLTPREREVLSRLVRAETTLQIASSMGITNSTARAYVQAVLIKLGVHSRLQAVSLVTRLGLGEHLGQTAG